MIFTIEDYAGIMNLLVWSKDYIEFERFIALDRIIVYSRVVSIEESPYGANGI